jgi:hypothetical protein
MTGCNGEVLASVLPLVCGLVNGRRDCCFMIVPPLTISGSNHRAGPHFDLNLESISGENLGLPAVTYQENGEL